MEPITELELQIGAETVKMPMLQYQLGSGQRILVLGVPSRLIGKEITIQIEGFTIRPLGWLSEQRREFAALIVTNLKADHWDNLRYMNPLICFMDPLRNQPKIIV